MLKTKEVKKETDFLVIGSGVAGLSFALKAANFGSVSVLSKNNLEETNTKYAQGGIAAVMSPPDSFEKHIRDTILVGDGLCDEEIVENQDVLNVSRQNSLEKYLSKLLNWKVAILFF